MSRKSLCIIMACLFLLGIGSPVRAEGVDVSGIVFDDANRNGVLDTRERPLEGVVVSDGKTVVATDERGSYQIQAEPGAIVFVSVPGTHHAAGNMFYRRLDDTSESAGEVNFPLVRNRRTFLGNRRFKFVFLSDTHVAPVRRAEEGTKKAYEHAARLKPAFVIHGGDIVFDALEAWDTEQAETQFALYKNRLAPLIKSPFYHAIGNHDVFGWTSLPDPDPVPALYGKKMYEKYFGPTYYSFNHRHCHFLVLDSIARAITTTGDTDYYGFIDPAQLDWVKKDLEKVDESRPIIIVMHIPMINALSSYFGLKSEIVLAPVGELALKHQISNFKELLGEVLEGYNFKLALAGHYHTYEQIHWKDNSRDALFVVGSSICGEWWKGDRTIGRFSWPEGFLVVDVNGEKFNISCVSYGWQGTEE